MRLNFPLFVKMRKLVTKVGEINGKLLHEVLKSKRILLFYEFQKKGT